jgi:uncharacterized protein YuzE
MIEAFIPFGVSKTGRIVTVQEVERGRQCECTCPACNKALIACQGDIVTYYFRHDVEDRRCIAARETGIHRFAKQVICETLLLQCPGDIAYRKLSTAIPEMQLSDTRPDVMATTDDGEQIAIEIWVAHKVPTSKIERFIRDQQVSMEIDLRLHRLVPVENVEQWREIVLASAPREWLFPDKATRELQAQRRAAHIQQLKEKYEQAVERVREADRRQSTSLPLFINHAKEILAELEKYEAVNDEQRLALDRAHRFAMGWPPDLQALVAAFGGYHRITDEAWGEWDLRSAAYQSSIRSGERWQRHA